MLKLYFLLLLLLGISSCTAPERKPDAPKEISNPVLDATPFISMESMYPPPPIDSAFLAVQDKISHTMSYYDYCGPTRDTELHFDSTGCLVAISIGPWIRNAISVIPEYTVHIGYSDENPAPSIFFTNSDRDCYYYNNKTKKVQKLAYEKLNCISEGLVGVAKRTEQIDDFHRIKYAFLNEDLEPICDFIYDNVRDFEHGVAVVEKEDQKGVLNKSGREIIPCQYEYIEVLESKRIQAQKSNHKFDLFTLKGRLIRKNYTEQCY